MTDPAVDAFFDAEWGAIASDLDRWLVYRGVPRQDVPDVVQETAVRLLRSWDTVDRTRPLVPYARVVALNVWRDRLKAAASREVSVAALPEPSVEHVEREVVARAEVAKVLAGFATLPETQQDAIRTALAEAMDGVAHEPR